MSDKLTQDSDRVEYLILADMADRCFVGRPSEIYRSEEIGGLVAHPS